MWEETGVPVGNPGMQAPHRKAPAEQEIDTRNSFLWGNITIHATIQTTRSTYKKTSTTNTKLFTCVRSSKRGEKVSFYICICDEQTLLVLVCLVLSLNKDCPNLYWREGEKEKQIKSDLRLLLLLKCKTSTTHKEGARERCSEICLRTEKPALLHLSLMFPVFLLES